MDETSLNRPMLASSASNRSDRLSQVGLQERVVETVVVTVLLLLGLCVLLLVVNLLGVWDWRNNALFAVTSMSLATILAGIAWWVFHQPEALAEPQTVLSGVSLGMSTQEVLRSKGKPDQLIDKDTEEFQQTTFIYDQGTVYRGNALIVVFESAQVDTVMETCPWAGTVHGVRCGDSAEHLTDLLGETENSSFDADSTQNAYRYDRLNTRFFLNQGRVFMVEIYDAASTARNR